MNVYVGWKADVADIPKNCDDGFVAYFAEPKHQWWYFFLPVPWVIVLVGCVIAATNDFQIAKRQRSAVAIVVAHHPEDHDSYEARLAFNGSQHVGRLASPRSGSYAMNESVKVFFDPLKPTVMSQSSFADDGWHALRPIPFILLATAFMEWWAFGRWKNRTKPVPSQSRDLV